MLGEHPHPSGAAMRGGAGNNLHSSLVRNASSTVFGVPLGALLLAGMLCT